MRILPVGREAVLVELAHLGEALALAGSLRRDPAPGLTELVPAARTVLLRFDPGRTTPGRLGDEIRRRDLTAVPEGEGDLVEIPVVYDGEDLAEVADLCAMSPEEVVTRHAAVEYTVAFTGFAPGFAYLAGGDPALRVPRRTTPRTAIPAGSVAVAGEYSGIYPRPSPGGWRLLGRTDAVLFDLDRDPPALLRPGGRVRFVPSPSAAVPTPSAVAPTPSMVRCHFLTEMSSPRLPADADAGRVDCSSNRALEILEPGAQTLVQDLGRTGVADLGVSPSGAMDRAALRRANRLVGNPPGSPALEVALGGLTVRARGNLVVAVTGARLPVRLDGIPVPQGQPVAVPAGRTLELGAATAGVYAYLAVRDGLAVPSVLGSTARDVLAGLGPEPPAAGEVLPVGRAARSAVLLGEPGPDLPAAGETVVLDIVPGPREDWFAPGALDLLTGQPWDVTPQSNRVGLRLAGAEPLRRARPEELPSEAVVRGALQVPADGQPVLFAADHPLTGGYPVIGCVSAHHRDLAAQVPPGAMIRFRLDGP